jgi:uncharacterized protein (TIGR01777 family)
MNILITGGSGLIGTNLVTELRRKNHEVRILSRKKSEMAQEFYWNVKDRYIDDEAFENLDCIIHLAGAPVSERWTDEYKKEITDSRIDSANLLLEYCRKHTIHLKSFISASGINFYGTFTSDKILHENAGLVHPDFLSNLSQKWEAAAEQFSEITDRVVCLRTSLVLSKDGGAFLKLKSITDLNIGSAIGSGKQWMNWIHVEDLVKIYVFAVENEKLEGSFNALADEVPTNKNFMKKLAKTAGKFFLPIAVPEFVLKGIFGEMSTILLTGTRASNEKIKSQGFNFKYNTVEEAFKSLL